MDKKFINSVLTELQDVAVDVDKVDDFLFVDVLTNGKEVSLLLDFDKEKLNVVTRIGDPFLISDKEKLLYIAINHANNILSVNKVVGKVLLHEKDSNTATFMFCACLPLTTPKHTAAFIKHAASAVAEAQEFLDPFIQCATIEGKSITTDNLISSESNLQLNEIGNILENALACKLEQELYEYSLQEFYKWLPVPLDRCKIKYSGSTHLEIKPVLLADGMVAVLLTNGKSEDLLATLDPQNHDEACDACCRAFLLATVAGDVLFGDRNPIRKLPIGNADGGLLNAIDQLLLDNQ